MCVCVCVCVREREREREVNNTGYEVHTWCGMYMYMSCEIDSAFSSDLQHDRSAAETSLLVQLLPQCS